MLLVTALNAATLITIMQPAVALINFYAKGSICMSNYGVIKLEIRHEGYLAAMVIEWASTTLEGSDHVVFRLEECQDCLTTMLRNAGEQMHSIISQLLLMWEATYS